MRFLDHPEFNYFKEAFEQAPDLHSAGCVLTALILTVSNYTGQSIEESFEAIKDWVGDHAALDLPANMLGTLAL